MPYANFEIRIAGEVQRVGLSGDHPLPEAGPVFLRLERRGSKFLAGVRRMGLAGMFSNQRKSRQNGPRNFRQVLRPSAPPKMNSIRASPKLQIVK